ncbi:hypothetical protein CJU89_2816 [Yarrowia sp. B02]|nr:hypothetical protein CJU89_2816 [Yarrowia sp. B02]
MSNKPFSLKPMDSADGSPNYNMMPMQSAFQYYQVGHEPGKVKVETIDPTLQEPHSSNQQPQENSSMPMQGIPAHDPYAAYSFRYVHPPTIGYHQHWHLVNPVQSNQQPDVIDLDSGEPSYFNGINPNMLNAQGANHYTTMAHYSLSPASPGSVISNIPSAQSTPPDDIKKEPEEPENRLTPTTVGFRIPTDQYDYSAVLHLENAAMAQSHIARDFDRIQFDTAETKKEFLRRCGNPFSNLSAAAPVPEAEYCAVANPGKGGRLTIYEPMYKSYISSKMLEDYFLSGTELKPRPGNPKCLSKCDTHGQCRYCGEFLVMRNHSYSSHMYSKHGISATTNNVLPLPTKISSTENKRGGIKLQGYCSICRTNVDLNERAKENEWISWFYHQQAHNVVERKQ